MFHSAQKEELLEYLKVICPKLQEGMTFQISWNNTFLLLIVKVQDYVWKNMALMVLATLLQEQSD